MIRLIPRLLLRDDSHGFEMLRIVRNECREGLTHTRDYITVVEQEQYRRSYPDGVRHYLFLEPADSPWCPWWDRVVGFSRLEYRVDYMGGGGHIYPTYGVAPWARGKGYAWDIVKHTLLAAGNPLRGDLLVSNKAIQKVDYALGWVPVGEPVDGVQQVECEWPPPFLRAEQPADAQARYDEIVRYHE